MTDAAAQVPPARLRGCPGGWRVLLPAAVIAASLAVAGWVLPRTMRTRPGAGAAPAGFGRGVLHGALMPLALPQLLIGRDLPIYAANNTGRAYKIGYTTGVNGCGALFFGLLYRRFGRRRRETGRDPTPPD